METLDFADILYSSIDGNWFWNDVANAIKQNMSEKVVVQRVYVPAAGNVEATDIIVEGYIKQVQWSPSGFSETKPYYYKVWGKDIEELTVDINGEKMSIWFDEVHRQELILIFGMCPIDEEEKEIQCSKVAEMLSYALSQKVLEALGARTRLFAALQKSRNEMERKTKCLALPTPFAVNIEKAKEEERNARASL